jgi:hypothetical protein
VKLGRLFGRIGFVFGFVGPILFYSLHVESHIVCPTCPHIFAPFAHPLGWLEIALKFGLIQGLVFALLGFAVGFSISWVKQVV